LLFAPLFCVGAWGLPGRIFWISGQGGIIVNPKPAGQVSEIVNSSVSLTTDRAGTIVSEGRYLPYGEDRWTEGTTPTDFGFTA
jgi:hypothetical protein